MTALAVRWRRAPLRALVPFGILLVIVGSASAAWACGPSAQLAAAPRSGPAATTVTVAGDGFSDGIVEIRWGRVDGPVLATTRGPTFSTSATIPHARPGLYALIAIDVEVRTARSAFFDLEPGGPLPPVQPTETLCANAAEDSFSDVDGTTFEAVIECLSHSGITVGGPRGLPADQYGPDLPVTRAQMATFIVRALDTAKRLETEGGVGELAPFDGTNDFVDVAPGDVHREAINRLSQVGITAGGPDGRPANEFGPDLLVTRAQMATFIDRAHHLLTGATLGPATDYFTDDDGDAHEDSIGGVALEGIAVGDGISTFLPHRHASRGQMAAFLVRHLAVLEEYGAIAPLPA